MNAAACGRSQQLITTEAPDMHPGLLFFGLTLSTLKWYILYTSMPVFEFDPAKSESNRRKHGIDFLEAQEIWSKQSWIEIDIPSFTEKRFQVLGMAANKLWSAIITYRGDSIRIISVRRARVSERRRYEESTQKKGEADS